MDRRSSSRKPARMTDTSSPHHRHDGSSPLPLGMDASPAPRQWNGLHTVWPHDPRTGWSYCATIPSWIVLPKTKNADGVFTNPIVFYKVEIGIQSPEGLSSSRGILRRFSDFLKLFAALKRVFPKKLLAAAPPKGALSRINSNNSLLQERRYALEDWIGTLLMDLEVSRSAPIASFLELEAAARSAINAFSEVQRVSNSAISPIQMPSLSFHNTVGGSSISSGALSSTFSDDIATPRSEISKGLEIEMESLVIGEEADSGTNIGSLGFHGEHTSFGIQNELESARGEHCSEEELVPSDKEAHLLGEKDSTVAGEVQVNPFNLSPISTLTSTEIINTGLRENSSLRHQRTPSAESLTSVGSLRETEPASSDLVVMTKTGQLPHFDAEFLQEVGIMVRMDQRERVKRVMLALQRRFAIAKADMEDLVTRLNQETATSDFLTSKVRDLEAELRTIHHKNRLAMQQATSFEHDRVISLQWEIEEARVSLMDSEETLHVEKEGRTIAEKQLHISESTCESLKHQILQLTDKLERTEKNRDSLEAQARTDMRILAKELKNLRRSQPEIKEELKQALQAKAKSELLLKEEMQRQERARKSHAKFLHEIATLHQRLKECNIDVLAGEDLWASSRVSHIDETVELITTSDNRISLLLAESQLLAQEEMRVTDQPAESRGEEPDLHSNGSSLQGKDEPEIFNFEEKASHAATRKMLTDILVENALLRKAINSVSRGMLLSSENSSMASSEEPARKSILNRLL